VIAKILLASAIFRKRYGNIRGFVFWFSLLREKLYKKGQIFSVRVPGIRSNVFLRANTSDLQTLCQIFCHAELDTPISRSVSYIIDAGANIGLASIFLANKFPEARIDALEVAQDNIDMLRLNVRSFKNVVVHPVGLWSRKACLQIVDPTVEPWAIRVQESTEEGSAAIPAVGVLDLVATSGYEQIDILKIDIEGAEIEVLDASAAWIDRVKTMYIELHDRDRAGCSDALRRAVSRRPHEVSRSGEYYVIDFATPDERVTSAGSLGEPTGAEDGRTDHGGAP